MKVYKQFLTGIAAIALVFSGLMGCETPTGDTGPRGADAANYLTIETGVTVIAPGSTGNVFKAKFKGDDVSNNALTKWEVSGDGTYANFTGSGTPIDGRHQYTSFAMDGSLLAEAKGGGVILDVDKEEEAVTLHVTATHGGYSASVVLPVGARGLQYIRLIPGSTDGTTRIDLYELDGGTEKTVLTQPAFGYYFVWQKTDEPDLNVLTTKTLNVPYTVNEAEDILVRNGEWITIYEVPQNNLTNETVHGYVSLQVHSSTYDKDLVTPTPEALLGTTPHDILAPNLFQPPEYDLPVAPALHSVLDVAAPLTGTTAVVTQGPNYAAFFEGKYRAYAIDQLTWESKTFKKDAALGPPAGAVEVTGESITLPTQGTWYVVVQHIASGAWWEIGTATVKHSGYIKGWAKTRQENLLTITVSGGKKLTDWRQITVDGRPFTLKPLSGWDDAIAQESGYTQVQLSLGDVNTDAPGGIPTGAAPENLFVSGSGDGVPVSIPANHFAIGTSPVTRDDPDIQVTWGVDATIRGRVIPYIDLKDDNLSRVQVVDTYTRADITSHYTFQWYYVNGKDWEAVPYKDGTEGSYGQNFNEYQGGNVESAAKRYLGLKVIPQGGYDVRTDKEFVFGAFFD
jgi:hypothetical protein